MNAHGITVMCHIAPPLVSLKQLKPGSVQVCQSIVFIGKVIGIDCGFLLTGNFQYIKDTVGFGIIFELHSII